MTETALAADDDDNALSLEEAEPEDAPLLATFESAAAAEAASFARCAVSYLDGPSCASFLA